MWQVKWQSREGTGYQGCTRSMTYAEAVDWKKCIEKDSPVEIQHWVEEINEVEWSSSSKCASSIQK